ncbi:unnamed protein product [Clonostachys solani]|uniref:AB hydrolase-1 domain-containing protein n=1 Tax=Clonostachys solani TaxID=160281 RepID=A0A9N9VSI7_9HYPO|nr:unnamed protein product [Clonostachys solani]
MSIRVVLHNVPSKALGRRLLSTFGKGVHENQTFGLPDGREYSDSPSTVAASGVDELARRRGVRVISLDRPGYGPSTTQPNRTIMDWPADIQAFAEGMKLDKFAIIGGSGGGPYAPACAHALPREMLAGVGLFASAPPWAAGAHHMSRVQRVMCYMANNTPGVLSAVMRVLVGAAKKIAESKPGQRKLDELIEKLDKEAGLHKPQTWESEEAEAKGKKDQRDFTMNLLVGEPMRQGVDAAVRKAKLLSARDWGFKFEDVGYNQVWIWHGANDANAPIVMVEYLAKRLPHCTLRAFSDDTHFTMFKRLEVALDDLFHDENRKS